MSVFLLTSLNQPYFLLFCSVFVFLCSLMFQYIVLHDTTLHFVITFCVLFLVCFEPNMYCFEMQSIECRFNYVHRMGGRGELNLPVLFY